MCTISNLPASLPEGSVFDVSLFYAANGLLHVLAKHNDSGLLSTASVQRECTGRPTTTALELPYVHRGVD